MPFNAVVCRINHWRTRDRGKRKFSVAYHGSMKSTGIISSSVLFLLLTVLFIVNLLTQLTNIYLENPWIFLQQIILAFRFYATGTYYQLTGDSFGIYVASMARCVDQVSHVLSCISSQFIKFLASKESSEVKRCFYVIAGDESPLFSTVCQKSCPLMPMDLFSIVSILVIDEHLCLVIL